MKYWKLKSNGAVESHDDHVNISGIANEITKAEFDAYIAGLVPPTPTDYKALYAAATTDAQRIAVLAQKNRLV